jgi:hypothetical protein
VVAVKRPTLRPRVTAPEDPPPHEPLHFRTCARCAAWKTAHRLGYTLAEYCEWQKHAYENAFGDHPAFVPGPEPDPTSGLR